MDTPLKDFILSSAIFLFWISSVSSLGQDTCNWSTFNASCGENQVIRMELAQFGRMSLGTCIKRDYGIGCQLDVLSYLDSVCSGKRTCQLSLPDKYLATGPQPCLELESYLQLKYNCIHVYTSPTPCAGKPLKVSGTTGLLANFITQQKGQGSVNCPWRIHGSLGQKIRLTLNDYGVWNPTITKGAEGRETGNRLPENSGVCHIYARISEGAIRRSITLCGGERREQIVYASETDGVEIALTNPKDSHSSKYFLLHYKVTGCPIYIPPDGAVVEKHDNDIIVRCTGNEQMWSLSCDGTQWTTEREVTSCTVTGESSMSIHAFFKSALTLPQWILIVLFIAAAVIIAVPIVVIGILKFRRNRDPVILSQPNPRMDAEETLLHPTSSSKEFSPIRDIDKLSEKAYPRRDYTSTVDRHMAVRPGAVPPTGGFRTLPLQRAALASVDGNNTIHGSSRHPRHSQEERHSSYKPPVIEDGYEMPNCLRHTGIQSDSNDPLYKELDPVHTDLPSGDHADSPTED